MDKPLRANDKAGIFWAFLAALVFGVYPPAARAAYADGANAVFVVLVTTFVRTALMAGYCLATHRPLFRTGATRLAALKGGIAQSISVIGIITGLTFMQGPLVIIIVFSYPLMLLLFMAWKKEISLDVPKLACTVTAFLGLAIALDIFFAATKINWVGVGLVFMAALATVYRMYVYGRETKNRDPAIVGAENFLVACLVVLFLMLWQMPHAPASLAGLGWTLLGGVTLGFGTFAMLYAIGHIGAFRAGLLSKMEPLFTALFSAALIGEYLIPRQYIGIGLVLLSLLGYQLWDSRKKRRAASSSCKTPIAP